MTVDGEYFRAGRAAQFDKAQKTPRGSSLGNPPRLYGDIILNTFEVHFERHGARSGDVKCWIIKILVCQIYEANYG